ncbi:hypothetical protein TNCV_4187391 [Trichonephila clavipes]|nr:hypothetical protein TNCV_4187391 [Trichonephila clavipes]
MCEIQRAEITLVKLVQQMEFNSEIKDLSCKGMVNPQSKIRNLSPFLDSENVLRVGGRLAHSKLCFDKKHQIILEVYHGKDNKIRVVLVKTKNGIFKRPITKLCILPFSSE